MKLFQHPSFRDAIIAAQEHFAPLGLTEQLIEKDYYVTEALRLVANSWPTQVIFKGGTSLSKGWKLIERFSEDIDLFLYREAFNPPLSRNGVDRELKAITEVVSNHPGLTLLKGEGFSKKGVSRNSYFSYSPEFSAIPAIANRVLLEMGTRSGSYPTEEILLRSYLAEFLEDTQNSLDAEDESPFPMVLLHFRRTFVEKMFTIHSKVVMYQQQGTPIGSYARHYYDLFCLAQHPQVQQMLQSEEYQLIKTDCDQISRQSFPKSYIPPENMSFSTSEALFPTGELSQVISREYTQQCSNLCYSSFPDWAEVEACFVTMADLL